MKRILLGALGNLAALFAAGMDHAWERPIYARQFGARRQVRAAFKLTGRPTDKRHWHTGQGAQIHRIDDAQEKRAYRAEKLERNTMSSTYHNPCLNGRISNLNPFYVAK